MSPPVSFLPPHFPTNPSHLRSTWLVREDGAGREGGQGEKEVPGTQNLSSIMLLCSIIVTEHMRYHTHPNQEKDTLKAGQ